MLNVMAEAEREKLSQRMCAGCGRRSEPAALVRLVVGEVSPFVAVDLGRRLGGRGVSVHPDRACIRSASLRGGLARVLRGAGARVDPESIEHMIVQQLQRRVAGLLSSAQRKRGLALGAEAVRAALQAGRGYLLIRASDSRGKVTELSRAAIALGCATVTWGTKATMGDAFGRSDLGVLLVMDRGIARAVADCFSRIEALSEDG
jgi:predicted RNA-binding protein YlxR (DUF448 family)